MINDMSNRLPVLVEEIAAEHGAVLEASKDFVQHAIAAGHRLVEAKSLVSHGQWQDWLADNLPDVSVRTAQRYMTAARKVGKNDSVSFSSLAEILVNDRADDLDHDTWLEEMLRLWKLMGAVGQDRFRTTVDIVGTEEIPAYLLHLDTRTLRKVAAAAAAGTTGGANASGS